MVSIWTARDDPPILRSSRLLVICSVAVPQARVVMRGRAATGGARRDGRRGGSDGERAAGRERDASGRAKERRTSARRRRFECKREAWERARGGREHATARACVG
eukprot:6178380-Pleurochrysis_carterae.AAC.1